MGDKKVLIKALGVNGIITSVCGDALQVQYKVPGSEKITYDYFIADELRTSSLVTIQK